MRVLAALSVTRRPVLGFVAMGVMFGSFAAHVPVLKAQIGADDALFGLLLLGAPAGLILTLWIAPQMDLRLGAWSLPGAAALVAAAFLTPGLTTTPEGFLASMALLGLTAGLLDIVSNTRVSEIEARRNQPLMNANHAMFSLAYAISAVATGLAREAGFGPVAIFTTLSVLVMASSVLMRTEVTQVSETERRASRAPFAIVALCGGIVLLAFFVEAVVESWSALHIERTLDGGAAEGALGPAILGLTMAVGRFSGQAVSGRFADVTIITAGSILASLGAGMAAIAWTPPIAYAGFGIMGLGVSVVGPLALGLVGRLVPPAHRSSAVARVNALGFMAFLLAPVVMGQVSGAYGLRWAFVAVGVLTLLAPIFALMLRRASPGTTP